MSTDLDLLLDVVRGGGEVAERYWGRNPDAWDKANNAGPVSQADIETDNFLRHHLRAARPDYGWLSEETTDGPERLDREYVFVVDPIDGTRSYLEGGRTWAISAAVVRNGEPVAAVIHMPAKGLTYVAARGEGAFLNGNPINASTTADLAEARVLAARPALEAQHWRDGTPIFNRHFRPSLAYRLALVAEGRFDAMLTIRPTWEWDIAAGILIANEAGAVATDHTGRTGRFNNPSAQLNGVLAGTTGVHSALGRHLKNFRGELGSEP